MTVKIGIALGGGGARGLAHFGVLKALEEAEIPVHFITGASIGAVAGAMYAQNPNAEAVIERFKEHFDEDLYKELQLDCLRTDGHRDDSLLHQITQNIKRRIVINLAQGRKALLKDVRLPDILSRFIDVGLIEETKIPLGILATDLHTGKDILFRAGGIIPAVAASASVSGFFEPVPLNGNLLTDGAVNCPVPVQILRDMGATMTIGVEICTREYHPLEAVNVIEIIARSEMITAKKLSRLMVQMADVAICPDTRDIYWSDFSRPDSNTRRACRTIRFYQPFLFSLSRRSSPPVPTFSREFSRIRTTIFSIGRS